MKKINIIFQDKIPQEIPDANFEYNAWIAPNGDFYGFSGAKHEIAATYLAVFKCGANENSRKKGRYSKSGFDQSWESWLLSQGWMCVKNLSWLGDCRKSTFRGDDVTRRQKDTVFDYCEHFNYDYDEVFGNGFD
jgi:hypothetical protein